MKQLTSNSKPGDLFCIPAIGNGNTDGMVMARYIEHIEPNVGHLIEVFAEFYTSPPLSIDAVDVGRRLFRPIMCSLRFAEIPRWRVLFSSPQYERTQSDYADIRLAFDTKLWIGGKVISATPQQMHGVEPSECWRTHHVVFRVNAHLAGIFSPDDCYDYHLLPGDLRVDNALAKVRVIEVAEALEQQLKSLDVKVSTSRD